MQLLRLNKENSGQALILVIVILVIIALIATSVGFRTLSDTRRTGQERASLDAFTYAESAIEDVSNQMKACLGSGNNTSECLTQLCNNPIECKITCSETSTCSILDNFSTTQCNSVSVLVKGKTDIEARTIAKDDVLEIPVSAQGASNISINWQGSILETTYVSYTAGSGYYIAASGGREYYLHNNPSFESGNVASGSAFIASDGSVAITPAKLTNVSILRLRAVGSDANVDISGVTDPFEILYSANGFCGGVSRSVVAVEPVVESLDGVFDYVLYSDIIEKDLP